MMHIVLSIPRLVISAVFIGVVIGGSQLIAPSAHTQAIQPKIVSTKTTVPYTVAPQPIVAQVTTPAPTPKPVTIVPKAVTTNAVAANTVTHNTVSAPVVTPAPSASVSGLAPVDPSSAPSATTTPPQTTTAYTSTNWSGYLESGGTFTGISGSWAVPKVTGTNGTASADATWIGIGGVSSGDLIQVGTQNTISSKGARTTTAFYEMLPHSSKSVTNITVNPGDIIVASLTETPVYNWKITITDTTNGQTYTKATTYGSTIFSSAEWIEEDPSTTGNSLVPFDTFNPVAFTSALATKNSANVNLVSGKAQPITLVSASDATIASASSIGSDGESFSVTQK
jgi:hypothetical protein